MFGLRVFRTPLAISHTTPAMPKAATVVSGMREVKEAGAVATPRSTVVFAPQMFVKTALTS